jgi:hypothetical protein
MNHDSARMQRESQTVDNMIQLYCWLQHQTRAGLCVECANLQEYARQRLEKCPFAPDKPTCAKCPVHCYRTEMREKIRRVMRFSGPRILVHHPWLAVRHLLDGFKKTPVDKRGKAADT